MGLLSNNIRTIRKLRGLTQETLADKIGVTRSVIGAYEEGRAEPKIQTLTNLAYYFGISIDALVNTNLQESNLGKQQQAVDLEGATLRILPITVTPDNREMITVVPIKAKAGYLNGCSDKEYIADLPQFNLPLTEITTNKSYRIFQITGDSMEPIAPYSYIITEHETNWYEVKDNRCYIVVTKDEGIVYKRLINKITEENEIILKSDNPSVDAYPIATDNILEVWKAIGYITFTLPEPEDISISKLTSMYEELKNEIARLKNNP
jgi:transcriptional regulator with XRE-family HTH domain